MRCRRAIFSLGFVFFSLTACFAHHMAVVVNKENGVVNITSVHLAKIVKSDTRKWADGKDIILVLIRLPRARCLRCKN
jgi:hypothetical protein